MRKICEYCQSEIWNKNKTYCNVICMTEHMRLRKCQCCGELKIKGDDERHFCSKECEMKFNKWKYKCDLETLLGLREFCQSSKNEIIKISYIFRNIETGEILNGEITFE